VTHPRLVLFVYFTSHITRLTHAQLLFYPNPLMFCCANIFIWVKPLFHNLARLLLARAKKGCHSFWMRHFAYEITALSSRKWGSYEIYRILLNSDPLYREAVITYCKRTQEQSIPFIVPRFGAPQIAIQILIFKPNSQQQTTSNHKPRRSTHHSSRFSA